MAWTPLSQRLASLPLVIAGPILRCTTVTSVTVWLVLRQAQTVHLEILDASGAVQLSGTRETVRIGANLHMVAVTAGPSAGVTLTGGQIYRYDLALGDGRRLRSPGVLTAVGSTTPIAYAPFDLPTFALPPSDLNHLRLLHGSCRKPHGESLDAMPMIDTIIERDVQNPNKRPHQLFLTGDQIYADDVADALLFMLRDAGRTLLGWEERLPGVSDEAALAPGKRVALTLDANFTASTDEDDKTAKSHLLTLGEYLSMYLFTWSDLLWPQELPESAEVYGDTKKHKAYAKEVKRLKDFRRDLGKVRRLLANLPTYMITDDHEVTDDWYINRAWCNQVFSSLVGRRAIGNGLAALALCQTWGNTPDQFIPGTRGAEFLTALVALTVTAGTDRDVYTTILNLVGVPADDSQAYIFRNDLAQKGFMAHAGTQPWHNPVALHFHIAWDTHEVIALDTRTWRAFGERSISDFPLLLSQEGFQAQIRSITVPTPRPVVTLVLIPGPVYGVPIVEWLQDTNSDSTRIDRDSEIWGLQRPALERLFASLVQRSLPDGQDHRFVLLCGDVHHGFTTRIQYWANRPFEANIAPNTRAILAQLTASGFKNEISKTRLLHNHGYHPIYDSIPIIGPLLFDHLPETRQVLGYTNPDKGKLLIGTRQRLGFTIDWETESGNPALAFANDPGFLASLGSLTRPPDWRYRVDYLLAEFEIDDDFQPKPAANPSGTRRQALEEYLKVAENFDDYAERWGNGKEIVGVNNFGEVTFQWGAENDRSATHALWWRLERESGDDALLDPFPLSRFVVSLNFDDPRYPQPPFS